MCEFDPQNLTLFTGFEIFRRCIGTHNSVPSFITGCPWYCFTPSESKDEYPLQCPLSSHLPFFFVFFYCVATPLRWLCAVWGSEQSILGPIRGLFGLFPCQTWLAWGSQAPVGQARRVHATMIFLPWRLHPRSPSCTVPAKLAGNTHNFRMAESQAWWHLLHILGLAGTLTWAEPGRDTCGQPNAP